MTNAPTPPRRRLRAITLIWLVPVAVTISSLFLVQRLSAPPDERTSDTQRPMPGPHLSTPSAPFASETESARDIDGVRRLCSACHILPPAASFPRSLWQREVQRWYGHAALHGHRPESIVAREKVVAYFQKRAPESLSFQPIPEPASDETLRFRKHFFGAPDQPVVPGVTNVRWVRLTANAGLDCLVCDMRSRSVYLWEHDRAEEGLRRIALLRRPAHVETADLDQDGYMDLLVADLGSFFPSDDKLGRVVWLRRDPKTDQYETILLAKDLGRVADVQAADFDGDGDLDLVAAVFGWRAVGEVLYFENRTTDYRQPDFHPTEVDERSGAIHVPVADLNGDGLPDFVALLSQQHETILAYINEGPGKFAPKTIYQAPDPAYGSTGIQLVDLDADADLDVLYTNGDLMDSGLLKPYHSVQWLENQGGYPFVHHRLAPLPGVHRAEAGDLDGDGDTDVLAVAFIPDTGDAPRQAAVIWLEQTGRHEFVPHILATTDCDYPTADLGDYDGDGDLDVVTGYMTWDGLPPNRSRRLPDKPGWIAIWENVTNEPGTQEAAVDH